MLDKIIEIIDKIGPLFYIIVPALFTVYYNTKTKVQEKEKELTKKNKEKAQEKYEIWEHEESRRIIKKVQDLCNFYKDKGHMDLVQFIQLENGTVASSKLCNMFATCLAEDNRFGNIPKMIQKLQRVPYSRFSGWVAQIQECQINNLDYYLSPDSQAQGSYLKDIVDTTPIGSSASAAVYDPNELLLGAVVFYYRQPNFNNQENEDVVNLIGQFKNSVESIFLNYHLDRKAKKRELGLESDIEED